MTVETKQTNRMFECLGGPLDGSCVELHPGDYTFRYFAIQSWHLYAVQAQDDGVYLCYTGVA